MSSLARSVYGRLAATLALVAAARANSPRIYEGETVVVRLPEPIQPPRLIQPPNVMEKMPQHRFKKGKPREKRKAKKGRR